jgi:prepilin-type N-terminal cleavage/methylation domain-containing protein
MNVYRISKSCGFTLLELLISIVILATCFLGILPLFFYSQAQIKSAIITNLAMTLIEDKMSRIVITDYEYITYDDFDGDSNKEYIYVLPEKRLAPCTTLPSDPCGFVPSLNVLRDYVVKQGYFFTRYIDIDDPGDSNSLESDDINPGGESNLPSDGITKRITITVEWTVPGGKKQFVRAATEINSLSKSPLG